MLNLKTKWLAILETGNPEIDTQHKQLFYLIEEFALAYLSKMEKNELTQMLFQLEDYVATHFRDEEKLLSTKEGLPSLEHLEQHKAFKTALHDLKFDYVSENKPIAQELFNHLTQWLGDHILGIDQTELKMLQPNKAD